MPGFATSRLTWEPRTLSILRIMVGLLYTEHGFAKILDFPHQPNHAPYTLFTLVPGLQGLLELIGGLLFALGLLPASSPLSSRGTWRSPISPRGFFPLLNSGELAIVYCFVLHYFWLAGGGEWRTDCLRLRIRLSPSRV